MTIWCLSDTHFCHDNMATVFRRLDGSPCRPFASTEEMDETMIERWNEVVRPSDHVYHLGDFTMLTGTKGQRRIAAILDRLNGHIRIVGGNHDVIPAKWYLSHGVEKFFGVRVMEDMVFTHIPVAPWSLGRFTANVHGHVHHNQPKVMRYEHKVGESILGSLYQTLTYVNLSVEVLDYRPVSLEEIKSWV